MVKLGEHFLTLVNYGFTIFNLKKLFLTSDDYGLFT